MDNSYTKDQRTVFVTQLVQRTKQRDLNKYFKKQGCHVNEVILLMDRRTGKHKGCAYVEMLRMDDVSTAVQLSGQTPDFQRFPILIKASEAEKNQNASSGITTAASMGVPLPLKLPPLLGADGKPLEAQKVYVGNLDPSVTQEHLFTLFSSFGHLLKVTLQMDGTTGLSKGFAFLAFHDPKEANLAIQTMQQQTLMGRPLKTGWANQSSTTPGVTMVTADDFPPDASSRAQRAYTVLAQLTMGVPIATIQEATSNTGATVVSAAPGTVAHARANMATSATVSIASGSQNTVAEEQKKPPEKKPTQFVLVRNMFDKDQETELDWHKDVEEEFKEECSKFGKLDKVLVRHLEPGGKIFAQFSSAEGADKCAKALQGRWFDQRQLVVEFVDEMPV